MTPGWSPRVCVARVGPRCSAFAVGGLVLGGWGCASGTAGGAGGHARTALEVGAQAVAALSVDDETRGGGVGAAVELSLPLLDLPSLGGQLLVRARAGAL